MGLTLILTLTLTQTKDKLQRGRFYSPRDWIRIAPDFNRDVNSGVPLTLTLSPEPGAGPSWSTLPVMT